MGKENLATSELLGTAAARLKNFPKVVDAIETWLTTFDDINDALALLEKAGLPCAKVQTTNELLNSSQLRAREMIVELETPDNVSTKTVLARGNPMKFSECKAILGKPPVFGQHNAEILREIGYDEHKIAQLKSKWKTQ
jgi:crotonobetainyl-CoA:carnitine CoA-transferase CaiB-like acyl-CoA transferase